MSKKRKLRVFFTDVWNVIDLTAYTFYFAALILRSCGFEIYDLLLMFATYLAIMRLLKEFYNFRQLGTYVFMIRRMVNLLLL